MIQALNAQEALHILDSVWFDAIVSEVSLPGLSGPEFFERVCARWPDLAQRFVFISNNPAEVECDFAEAARRGGREMPVLLAKPERDTLIGAVARAAEPSGSAPGVRAIRGTSPRSKALGG